MSKREENTAFVCEHCGKKVEPLTNGSYRNHCPFCLYSKHVDDMPGDRANSCGGLMKPIDIVYKSGKGYQIKHKCLTCGREVTNMIAENTIQPDDYDKILAIIRENSMQK